MTHKEIKKNVQSKLEATLVEFKTLMGEKKFNNRIKKAAKLLAEGLGKEPKVITVKPETKAQAVMAKSLEAALTVPVVKKVSVTARKAASKKTAVKKVPIKKVIVKKTAVPVVKKTAAKKASKTPLGTKKTPR